MSNLPIYAKDENGTVIFRCNSGNIHVVHDNVSTSFCEEIFYSYSANVEKTLNEIRSNQWGSQWVTVHCGNSSMSLAVDEFEQFATMVRQARIVLQEGEMTNTSKPKARRVFAQIAPN